MKLLPVKYSVLKTVICLNLYTSGEFSAAEQDMWMKNSQVQTSVVNAASELAAQLMSSVDIENPAIRSDIRIICLLGKRECESKPYRRYAQIRRKETNC